MSIAPHKTRAMTEEDLRLIVSHLPELTAEGLADEASPEFREQQEKLLQSVQACTRICRWLRRKARATRHLSSSYGLTFAANRDVGYITHGQFIAAAIHCGFRYRRAPGTSGIWLNMSL